MKFASEITIGDICAIISAIAVIVGGIFALYKWNKKLKHDHAATVAKITNKLLEDKELWEVAYLFDYGQKWYDENFHGAKFRNEQLKDEKAKDKKPEEGKAEEKDVKAPTEKRDLDLERKVDKLLTYYSTVCYLYKLGAIKDEEFRFLDYKIRCMFESADALNYLYNIYHYCKVCGYVCSFAYLIEYGKEKNYLKESFFDVTTDEQKRYLLKLFEDLMAEEAEAKKANA